jgi:undecaprenyl-diphosphatase
VIHSLPREIKQRTDTLWQRIRQTELLILVAIALIVGGVWIFIELADEVAEGATTTLDERLLLSLRNPVDLADPIGPSWVEEMMRDFTALGGSGVLLLLTFSVLGYLVIKRRFRAALLLALAVGGGVVLSQLLKSVFSRPRPDLVPYGSYVYFASFPSGHSMLSAATYLTLGALVARLQKSRRLQLYILCLAVTITFLVGISRVYLGVHWPTDVLAGWTAGAVWAALCALTMHSLQRRGQVEATVDSAAIAPPESGTANDETISEFN